MTPATLPALTLRSVSAGYPGRPVLDQVSGVIPAGQSTALTGANGSGKSTLLGVLAGLHAPSGGEVVRSHERPPAFVVQRSAVPDALPLTVRSTVAMGRWARLGPWRRLRARDRAVVAECLDLLGIAGLAGRQLGSLSGGQRQRALIAQGLAQESDILLLDEPAAGLDAESQEAVAGILAAIAGTGVTVVQATHDPAAAARCHQTLHLEDGRITAGPAAVR
ncbi:zinc ABC transporter ATP-binding protein AztA [Nocardiopsis coralliicola]